MLNKSDQMCLLVRRHGEQQRYIVHKSSACVAMDSRWLLGFDASQTEEHLKQQVGSNHPIQPLGVGLLVVDFDLKKITSMQHFKSVHGFMMDDFGFTNIAAPMWMHWPDIIRDACQFNCTSTVYFEQRDCPFMVSKLAIADGAGASKGQLMNLIRKHRPANTNVLQVSYTPPGWQICHQTVPLEPDHRLAVLLQMHKKLVVDGINLSSTLEWMMWSANCFPSRQLQSLEGRLKPTSMTRIVANAMLIGA